MILLPGAKIPHEHLPALWYDGLHTATGMPRTWFLTWAHVVQDKMGDSKGEIYVFWALHVNNYKAPATWAERIESL